MDRMQVFNAEQAVIDSLDRLIDCIGGYLMIQETISERLTGKQDFRISEILRRVIQVKLSEYKKPCVELYAFLSRLNLKDMAKESRFYESNKEFYDSEMAIIKRCCENPNFTVVRERYFINDIPNRQVIFEDGFHF